MLTPANDPAWLAMQTASTEAAHAPISYHAVFVPTDSVTGPPTAYTAATVQELQAQVVQLVGAPGHWFFFQGRRLPVAMAPLPYLLSPDGPVPLYPAPQLVPPVIAATGEIDLSRHIPFASFQTDPLAFLGEGTADDDAADDDAMFDELDEAPVDPDGAAQI